MERKVGYLLHNDTVNGQPVRRTCLVCFDFYGHQFDPPPPLPPPSSSFKNSTSIPCVQTNDVRSSFKNGKNVSDKMMKNKNPGNETSQESTESSNVTSSGTNNRTNSTDNEIGKNLELITSKRT